MQERATPKATGPGTDRDATRVLPEDKPPGVSAVEPSIGRTVHYYPTNTDLIKYSDLAQRAGSLLHGLVLGKTPVAAVIVGVFPNDRVNLRILLDAPTVPPHVVQAMFSEDPCVGRWSWPPLAQRR